MRPISSVCKRGSADHPAKRVSKAPVTRRPIIRPPTNLVGAEAQPASHARDTHETEPVTQQPDPLRSVSPTYRSRSVKDEPEPHGYDRIVACHSRATTVQNRASSKDQLQLGGRP
jgi:hypothetical protein